MHLLEQRPRTAHEALAFYTSGEQAAAKAEDAFEIVADSPIFAGDVLTMKGQLKSIGTREGKSGVRTIYTMENAFYDPQGKRVCALLIRTSEGQ